MAKDPAVLWYFNDWHGGTVTLSRFLKGCYMDILYAQSNSGNLSLDEIKTVLGSDFGQAWPTLQKKFKQDANGLYYNERLLFEKEKRKSFSGKQSERIKKRYESGSISGSTNNENENENENEDLIIKKGVPSKIEFIEYCRTFIPALDFDRYLFSLEAKYDSWLADGWKTGHNKPIKNWKNTIKNTFPFLKPIQVSLTVQRESRIETILRVDQQQDEEIKRKYNIQ